MVKKQKQVPAPVNQEIEVTTPVTTPVPAPVKAPRYAAIPVDHDKHYVTVVKPSYTKRGKSAARWALYQPGDTMQAYIERSIHAGNKRALALADLRWDLQHGLIEITPVQE